MSEYKINRNIPVPDVGSTRAARYSKYPFYELEVGESFFVPGASRNGLASRASVIASTEGWRFAVRLCYMRQNARGHWGRCESDAEGATLGVGVWREE